MASADVFKDIHANKVNIDKNNSSVTEPILSLKNIGSGDTTILLLAGSSGVSYTLGLDNSSAADTFQIRPNSGQLGAGAARSLNLDDVGVAIGAIPVSDFVLKLSSTVSAFTPPAMTSAQMQALSAPSGAMVFNTTSGAHYVVSGANGVWGAMYPAR